MTNDIKKLLDEARKIMATDATLRFLDSLNALNETNPKLAFHEGYKTGFDAASEIIVELVRSLEYTNTVLEDKIGMMRPTHYGKVEARGILQLSLEKILSDNTKALAKVEAILRGRE